MSTAKRLRIRRRWREEGRKKRIKKEEQLKQTNKKKQKNILDR